MKNLKRIISFTLIFCLILVSFNVNTVSASTLGSGGLNKEGTIKWSLSSEGILTINGSGKPDIYKSAAEVPWDALRDCIKKVQINTDTDGITDMSYWFKGCTNLTYINRFPDNVSNLYATFAGCTSLEEAPVIPLAVTKMKNTFNGCTSLKKIPEFEFLGVSDFTYTFKNCKSLEFAYMSFSYPVTSVKSIFYGCSNLNAMVIFNGCIQLNANKCADMFTGAADREGSSIKVFSAYMSMESVKQLINTDYPGVQYCGAINADTAFNYNYDYKNQCAYAYSDDNSILYIEGTGMLQTSGSMKGFSNTKNVKTVNIGYGITGIGTGAFEDYSSLETVILPETVTSIEKAAFKNCGKLKNVVLPINVKSIGEEAFSGCESMDSLYIPDSVNRIEEGAFSGMNEAFFFECSSGNRVIQEFAEGNGINCKYPQTLSVVYKGNVVEGNRIDGESFETIDLVYSDGVRVHIPFEEIVIDEYEIKTGENILTAHYGDFSTTFNITGIEKTIVKLLALYDTEYDFIPVEGGSIDTDAISVLAEYDNGTKEYLKYGGITGDTDAVSTGGYYTIDAYNLIISSDGGLNEITIRARVTGTSEVSKIVKINVPAEKRTITGISAQYIGKGIVEGTGINTENLYVYANFNNGTKERILFDGHYNKYGMDINTDYIVLDETIVHTDEFKVSDEYTYSIDAYKIKNAENTITLWCNNRHTTIEVMGIPKSQTGISAVYHGTAIEDGEVQKDKLEVSVNYNNGESEMIENEDSIFLTDDYVILKGDNYIDVTYIDASTGKKFKCSAYIKGEEKKPVEITNIIPCRTVTAGELLKNIEFNMSVLYDNGKVYDSKMSWDLAGCAKEGENRIQVLYKGLEGEAVFEAGEFIPHIITTAGTEPPVQLEKDSSVMVTVTANSEAALKGKEIGWASSNDEIVRVSETGMVTAINYGRASITATVNGKQAVYDIEVPMPDIKEIEAVYEGSVLEDTEIDMDNITVYLILENGDSLELTDISDISLEKDYCIKEGINQIDLYYIDKDTAKKYNCKLEVMGKARTPVEIKTIKAARNDIIAGEPLHTLEFTAEILYDNQKTYTETIKYEGKGFAEEGINHILVPYKGIWGEAEFEAGKFIPDIVLMNGNNVPGEVSPGDRLELKVVSNCDAAMENKMVYWRSSDENVITVDENGMITAVKQGTSDITAKVNDESVKCTIRVIVPSEKFEFRKKSIVMAKGAALKLAYQIAPEDSTDNISWVSSNTDVATVSLSGKVSAKGIGTCTITAITDSGIKRTVKVTVKKEATRITLNYKKAYLIKGKTLTLKYSLPANMCTGSIQWTSSNKKVAVVSSSGKVNAKGTGNAVISVKTSSGKKSSCKIYVRTAPGSVVLNKKSVTLKKGKTLKLKYIIPANSYVKRVTWSSSNKKIAFVSSAGKVKALKKGSVYIKIRTDNNKTAKCKVKVIL